MKAGSLSRPLGLQAALQAMPSKGWNWLPLMDLLVIAAFFSLQASRFIAAPGLEIALPTTPMAEMRPDAPPVVLTVSPAGGYYLGAERFAAARLQEALAEAALGRPASERHLLLKLDRVLSTEALLALLAEARRAGFTQVQLATEAQPLLPEAAAWQTP